MLIAEHPDHVPIGLLSHAVIRRPVRAEQRLTMDDVDLPDNIATRAWEAIDRALERAIASGDRVLLLITGHERRGDPPLERGRIRAAIHDWLAVSRHARRIAAVRGAHRRHGGGGSLYIILRKT